MSDTKKSKEAKIIIFASEKELEINAKNKNEQEIFDINSIPEIPKEISVDAHSFEILPNGEIVRHSKIDGKELGKVTNNNDIKAIKKEIEKEEVR